MKIVHFPHEWRKEPDSEFHAFLRRYNQMRRNREAIRCLECKQSIPFDGQWIESEADDPNYGTHFNTCYGCFKHYCHGCEINREIKIMLFSCDTCERDYCVGCTEMTSCPCGEMNCSNCYKHECHKCGAKICSDCVQQYHQCDQCKDCNTVSCSWCMRNADFNFFCSGCSQSCCSDCRLQRFRQGELYCARCINKVAFLLVGENDRLNEENQKLGDEVDELMLEVKELKSRIEK